MRTVSETRSCTVADCVAVLDAAYDPAWAEEWDAVGLTAGAPTDEVSRVHFAVDPTQEVADEAVAAGAQLLVTHHPLFLRGRARDRRDVGRRAGHRDADARRLRAFHRPYQRRRRPARGERRAGRGARAAGDRCPSEPLAACRRRAARQARRLRAHRRPGRRCSTRSPPPAPAQIGDYDRCAWWASRHRHLPSARRGVAGDRLGRRGRAGRRGPAGDGLRPPAARRAVVAALRAAHPYEEPAFDLVELAPAPVAGDAGRRASAGSATSPSRCAWTPSSTGWPRRCPPRPGACARPAIAARLVRRVAVCGGSGGELAGPAAALGADVLVTSDARHHHTLDSVAATRHRDRRRGALGDRASVAALGGARSCRRGLPATVGSLTTYVSDLVTDPWRLHSC